VQRKGYLERQIEGLAAVVAKLLRLKTDGDGANALREIQAGCKNLTGLDIDTFATLPDHTILGLLTSNDELDAGKAVVAAVLLAEQAEIHARRGSGAPAALARRRKAFTLLAEALVARPELRREPDLRARADDLVAHLGELSGAPLHRLFRLREALGEYARAEDALFALREQKHPGIARDAGAFYRRLLELDDDALTAGGLPRDEVEDALAQLPAGDHNEPEER
jgi:hypothetical protein